MRERLLPRRTEREGKESRRRRSARLGRKEGDEDVVVRCVVHRLARWQELDRPRVDLEDAALLGVSRRRRRVLGLEPVPAKRDRRANGRHAAVVRWLGELGPQRRLDVLGVAVGCGRGETREEGQVVVDARTLEEKEDELDELGALIGYALEGSLKAGSLTPSLDETGQT